MSGSCHSRRMRSSLAAVLTCALTVTNIGWAQITWDGGGGTDTSWGAAANWNNDSLPAFDGTDSLALTNGFGANTALVLGADRSIARLTFGAGSTAISLSGNTLRLTATNTSAGTGTALWNANTIDGVAATVNSAILLQFGAAGSYTGHLRENVNSGGGTRFNGPITQGAGENWTLRFSQASARGAFYLANASNSLYALRNDGLISGLLSLVPGAFGGAALILNSGTTGTSGAEHYAGDSAVSNSITLTGNATWGSSSAARLTGTLAQGANILTYSGGQLTRLEFGSVSGNGTTILYGGPVAPTSMSQFASGTLNLGDTTAASKGVLVLSGAAGNGLPTWEDFRTARTFNQAGGAGTWRINTNPGQTDNAGPAGGFAARGADLVIPHQSAANAGGITSATFARNFALGTSASVGGTRYATNAVIVNTDIAFGSTGGSNRYVQVANNAGLVKSSTAWTLAGPIHELNGVISGTDAVIMPLCNAASAAGMVRVSNPGNSLGGASRWILGATRSAFTTMDGGSVLNPQNAADMSSIVMIFTCDGVFGGAAEVQVASRASSGSQPSSMLLFEDTNTVGSTTFTRNINVLDLSEGEAAAAWGAYGGEVVYQGTVTTTGSVGNLPIHVESGTLTLGSASAPATLVNNRSVATALNKGGNGVLELINLSVGGTQTNNAWAVYQGVLRETGNGLSNSVGGMNLKLAGGVLETSDGLIGGAFTRGLGAGVTQVQWAAGGGGFAAFGGPLTVNVGGGAKLTWGAGSFCPATAPLILGSATASNPVTVLNELGFGTGAREVRVTDNPGSAADRAVLAGELDANTGSTLVKTGSGVLELAVASAKFLGQVTVNAGTLLVNGTIPASTGVVTVAAGGTLGGTGRVNHAVTVNDGGLLVPGDGGSGTLTVSNLTLAAGSTNVFAVGGPTSVVAVNGNLSVAGTFVVTNASGVYSGTYEVMTYSGGLTAGTVSVGPLPVGVRGTVDLATPGKVLVRLSAPGMVMSVR